MDIDFAKHIPERIHLSACGKRFWKYIDIPNYPKVYSVHNIIGHTDEECKNKTTTKYPGTETNQQLVLVDK